VLTSRAAEQPDRHADPLPDARPLVVDEAYYEYSGETAVPLLDDGVVVGFALLQAFGLAGAPIAYALARRDVADELKRAPGSPRFDALGPHSPWRLSPTRPT